MLKKIVKVGISAIILTLSPFIIVAIIGLAYILFNMIGGTSFIDGYQLFIQLAEKIKPYAPLFTFVPMVFIGLPIIIGLVKKKKSTLANTAKE